MSASRRSKTGSPRPGGTPGGHHVDARTDGVAFFAQRVHVRLQLRHRLRVRTEEGVAIHLVPVEARRADRPQLGKVATHRDPQALVQVLLGDGTRGDAHGGFPRRGAPAAAIISPAVLVLIAVVGVRGTEPVGNLGVVLGPLIDVLDHEMDWRSGGPALEHAGEKAHLVGFAPLGGVTRLSRSAPLQVLLKVLLIEEKPRRAAVHDAANGGPMALAVGRDAEQPTKRVPGHGGAL